MGRDTDIVLIDSDDEDIKSNKRVRLDTPDLFRFGTPFAEGLSTPKEDVDDHHHDPNHISTPEAPSAIPPAGSSVQMLHPIATKDAASLAAIELTTPDPTAPFEPPPPTGPADQIAPPSSSSDDEQHHGINNGTNYDSDDSEPLAVPSSLAPFGASQTPRTPQAHHMSLDDENRQLLPGNDPQDSGENDDSSDESLDQVCFGDVPQFPQELIVETRKYLKANGNVKFLEKYLPTTSSAQDIINLIFQLGFVPKMAPLPNMMELVQTLNRAMVKVKSIRDRLDTLVTVEDAIDRIKQASNILVITGAGISTSIGIPDFRSSKGFYSQIQHLGLTDPQEVFDLENFHMDPSLFYSIAHMIIPPEKVFSPLHAFVRLLQDKGKLLRNYTQNIDNLESYAGIARDKLIQCHGSFATASCITCGYQIGGEEIFPDIRNKHVPTCPKCAKTKSRLMKNEESYIPDSFGVFKPDITFFGEPLPKVFHDSIMEDLNQCDLLISIGTSLKVAPVADIVDKIPQDVPQLLINKDPITHCNFDVSFLGYCDDVASFIANRLGDDWAIPHKDYDAIRGANGRNLVVELVDADFREYQVTNIGPMSVPEPGEIDGGSDSSEDGGGNGVVSRPTATVAPSFGAHGPPQPPPSPAPGTHPGHNDKTTQSPSPPATTAS